MRRLLPFAIGAALAAAMPAAAHDFWIDAADYHPAAGQAVPVRFLIGDIGAVEPWETLWRKIVSFRSYGPGGVVDLQSGIRPTTPTDPGGATIGLSGAGTHVVAFESYQAENDIAAAEFNAYAAHEGLALALNKRRRDGSEGARGRELYSRRGKALFQIGTRPTDDATRPIGQTLEIVPQRNPYALGAGEPLVVRILYRGAALPGASVVMERLDGAARHGTPVVTDGAGLARFPFAKTGRWRVGVVWTQPIDHPRAEFDTVFSSLTFGF